jgi:hypothetical protein
VDGDGVVTENDLLAVCEIANGHRAPVSRADVDGNGMVDALDVGSISNVLSGASLPGWWDELPDRAQRNAWIDRVLALDVTSDHPFRSSFQCVQFALQLFINAAYYRENLRHAPLSGGQTGFNVPLYTVSISAPGFGHAINAILVGDDPRVFEDWRFIEPQTDETVDPGDWDMPYGSQVLIYVPRSIFLGGGGASMDVKVGFDVEADCVALSYVHPSLITSRSSSGSGAVSNSVDRWSPRLAPIGDGYVFFDRYRDDLGRVTDVHGQSFSLLGTGAEDEPVTKAPQYSRLRDVAMDHADRLLLLWSGKPAYCNGLILGTYDPQTREMIQEGTAVSNDACILGARVRVTKSGVKHVFWTSNWGLPQGPGVYWSRSNDGSWSAPTNLTPDLFMFDLDSTFQHAFDAEVLPDDRIVLVWDHNRPKTLQAGLRAMVYDGETWGSSSLLEGSTNLATHIDLCVDSAMKCHLAYTREGQFRRRQFDGLAWTDVHIIPAVGGADRPCLSPGAKEEVYATWRSASNRIQFACYVDGQWVGRTNLASPDGVVDEPSVARLPNGDIALAWSVVNDHGAFVRTHRFPSDADADHMSDFWESAHDLDPTQADDAGEDPDLDGLSNAMEYAQGGHPRKADTDGDGVSDGDEFVAGTGLRDAQSYLSCRMGPSANDGRLQLVWPSVSGRVYSIHGSVGDPGSGRWVPLEGFEHIPTLGDEQTVTLPDDMADGGFYRLEVKWLD